MVQEMLDYVQNMPSDVSDSEDTSIGEANAICLSAAAMGDTSVPIVSTMKLKVKMQGLTLIFLVDSCSIHSFD